MINHEPGCPSANLQVVDARWHTELGPPPPDEDDPPKASGVIRLEGGTMDGRILGWRKDWPPPEHLICAQGRETGTTALAAADSIPEGLMADLLRDAVVTRYVRISYSKLSNDMVSSTFSGAEHIARVALYGYDGRVEG